MHNRTIDLSAHAKALPPADRARLAEELLASLDPRDSDVAAAWGVEIRRRVEEVERGAVELVPGDQVFSALKRVLQTRPRASSR